MRRSRPALDMLVLLATETFAEIANTNEVVSDLLLSSCPFVNLYQLVNLDRAIEDDKTELAVLRVQLKVKDKEVEEMKMRLTNLEISMALMRDRELSANWKSAVDLTDEGIEEVGVPL